MQNKFLDFIATLIFFFFLFFETALAQDLALVNKISDFDVKGKIKEMRKISYSGAEATSDLTKEDVLKFYGKVINQYFVNERGYIDSMMSKSPFSGNHTKYVYDPQGEINAAIYYDEYNKLKKTQLYKNEYDSLGRHIVIRAERDSHFDFDVSKSYMENGNYIVSYHDNTDATKILKEIKYNSDGQISELTRKTSGLFSSAKHVKYEYDSLGRKKFEEHLDSDGKLIFKSTTEYSNKVLNTVSKTVINVSVKNSEEKEFIQQSKEYYNDKNQLVKFEGAFDGSAKLVTYEYDEKGNWIKRFQKNHKGSDIISYREIIYY